MVNIDMSKHFDHCLMTIPANVTTTVTSNAVNLQTYNACSVLAIFGDTGDTLDANNYWTFKLQESNTWNAGFTDVDDSEVIEDTNAVVINTNAETSLSYRLTYIGDCKYVRAVITPTGQPVYGIEIAVEGILGHQRMGPTTQTSIAVASS